MSKPVPRNVRETPEVLERSVKELARALDGLPDDSKSAYMEAMAVAPEVVKAESMPEWFLRVEGFNAEAAAIRLANYWRERKVTFGVERAFLPLADVSGRGALSEDDLRVRQMQFFKQLPDDAKGRPVIVSDLKRVGANYSLVKPGAFRFCFYFMLTLSKNPAAQTEGIVALRVMKDPKFNGDLLKRCMMLCATALPIRFLRYHVCCLPPPQSRKYFTDIVAPIIVKAVTECFVDDCPVHVTDSEAAMLSQLQSYDLLAPCLPTSLGGTWLYEGEETGKVVAPTNPKSRKILAGDAEPRKRPKYEQPTPAATPKTNVHNVLRSLAKLRDARKFGSVKDVLSKPAVRKRVMELIRPISQATVGNTRPLVPIGNNASGMKQELKKRLLKKMLERGTLQREAPMRPSSSLRTSLVARVLDRLALHEPRRKVSTHEPATTLVGAAVADDLLGKMRECIHETPREEKVDYVKACEVAPHVVAEDSKPEWFLRIEHNNASAAALRLVSYWKERRVVFGDRAFLPLADISGDGALTKDDVESMKHPTFAQLPNDSKGRIVFLSDLAALNADVQAARLMAWRLMFYWALVLSGDPSVQDPGIAILHVVTENKLQGPFLERSFRLFQYAIPVRFDAYHFCSIPLPERRNHVKEIVAPLALHTTGGFLAGRVTFHLAESPWDMMKKLEKHGFLESGVPLCLGGTFDQNSKSKDTPSSRNTETTNPSIVLKALQAVQKSKNCTISDLMKIKGLRKHVFALLERPSSLDYPTSKVSSEGASTPMPARSMHEARSSAHKRTEVKTRLLKSVLGRFGEGSAGLKASSSGKPMTAMRRALTTKVVQELLSKREKRSAGPATNGSVAVSSHKSLVEPYIKGSVDVSSQMVPATTHTPNAVADVLRALQLTRESKGCSLAELITKQSVQVKARELVSCKSTQSIKTHAVMQSSLLDDANSIGDRARSLKTKAQLIENVLQQLKGGLNVVTSSATITAKSRLRNALNDLVLQKLVEKRN